MFCDTGKICYLTVKEASVAVANLNKQDKKNKHYHYKCQHCKTFHTSTVKKLKKLPRKAEKYKFRYQPPLKEEFKPAAKKRRKKKS